VEAAAGAWGEADRGPARTGADHVAHLLVRAAMEATGARRGSLVWRLGERWMLHTAVGFEAKRMPQGMAVEAGLGVLGALFKEGRPMVVEDIRGLPEVAEDRSRGYTTRAFLAIPLYWTGKPAGALFLTNREGGRAFATEDLALILPLVKTLMDCLGGKVAEAESRVLH
ncbi:MAG: GAF domain-containing protein, partial [Candidatus Methylomirabilis sp.]|nr:GAF domain-containing protein [Deltaproteobacteria bacterium]